ncbi:MAG: argininosuccinate synthase [Abditibacteriales bacterium]|nr:argininosuccinate synthase [Abditibacteriales bacterium]MDW8364728.1 argininosuccinate synthase [Abditibacteriales bacterium]
MDKVVLAYSGGLDTSVAIKWIPEKYGMEVIALTVDLGSEHDLESIREKALTIGAAKAIVVDGKQMFVDHFVFPALKAGAIYEGAYPLATALGRPLISYLLVKTARAEGAKAVAHGSTGKGNDQVRFDVSVAALAPDLKVIAPVREWAAEMTRDKEIEYAQQHGIPVPVTAETPFSIDVNLWGRSCEAGVLEDPWTEPPEEAYGWTVPPTQAPDEPAYVTIEFDRGIPVALDGERLDGVTLITRLNDLAGQHGVGRIDHLENRLVGIKSREVYEAPAAVTLHAAHQALEKMTLSKDQMRTKAWVAQQIADIIYNGLWFSANHQDLRAYVESTQRYVTGKVRVKLLKGNCTVVGVDSPHSLYQKHLATYDTGDQFDHTAALGFIKLWGLPLQTQARVQMLPQGEEPLSLPSVKADG